MGEKRIYWLKVTNDFFSDKIIKTMRRRFGSDGVVIYQKLLLSCLKDNFVLTYEHLEDTFFEEIAADIGEDATEEQVELVGKVIDFLIDHELIIKQTEDQYYFPHAEAMTGKEGMSAERMRRLRAKHKEKQPDQKPENNQASQCDGKTSQDYYIQRQRQRTEKETETETETETDIYPAEKKIDSFEGAAAPVSASAFAFSDSALLPDIGELSVNRSQAPLCTPDNLWLLCRKNKVNLNAYGCARFFVLVSGNDWTYGADGKPIENVLRVVREYAKHKAQEDEKINPEDPYDQKWVGDYDIMDFVYQDDETGKWCLMDTDVPEFEDHYYERHGCSVPEPKPSTPKLPLYRPIVVGEEPEEMPYQ